MPNIIAMLLGVKWSKRDSWSVNKQAKVTRSKRKDSEKGKRRKKQNRPVRYPFGAAGKYGDVSWIVCRTLKATEESMKVY